MCGVSVVVYILFAYALRTTSKCTPTAHLPVYEVCTYVRSSQQQSFVMREMVAHLQNHLIVMFVLVGRCTPAVFAQGFGEAHPQNPKVVSDMTALHYIHEAGILHNLRERSKLSNQRPYSFMVSFLCHAQERSGQSPF